VIGFFRDWIESWEDLEVSCLDPKRARARLDAR
jgi:hypothetical protein